MKIGENKMDKIIINNINLDSFISIDYRYTPCHCNEEICRCAEIIDERIIEIKYFDIIDFLIKKFNIKTAIDKYCFNRICMINKIYSPDRYYIDIINGYYGQEIDGIYIKEKYLTKIISEFNKMLSMTDIEKIKHLLTLEYGFILDRINNYNKVNIIECDISKIILGNENYYRKINSDSVDNYKDYDGITCLCELKDDKYRIIDGYHRLLSVCNMNKINKIKILLMEE